MNALLLLGMSSILLQASSFADSEVTITRLSLSGDDDSYYLLSLSCSEKAEKEHCEISLKDDQKFKQKKISTAEAHKIFTKFEADVKTLKIKKASGTFAASWSLRDGSLIKNGSLVLPPEKKAIDLLESTLKSDLRE